MKSLKILYGRWKCRWTGEHQERRLRKSEESLPGVSGMRTAFMICDRCGRLRATRQRKTKVQS